MPRAGQLKPPAGERLPDRIAIGLLTVTFPPEVVDRVVAETGRVQQRSRLLPARVVVYYVLAMCLFFGQGYEEVARLLTGGLAYARRWQGTWRVPTTAAITRARAKLGPEPLRALFGAVCQPLATEATAGAFYRQWRLVAVDGTTFDLPDTAANAGFFGRPGSRARAPSRRSGLLRWENVAPTQSSPQRWGRWRCTRPNWPGGCSPTCMPGCC
jgi:hypothetical protein